MKKNIITLLIFIFIAFLLGLAVKGDKGSPIYYQTEKDKSVGGPFESTNSTSRYALVEAIVEDNTFSFNHVLAKFSSADIVSYNGKIFSIFTPGVSFVGIPFYLIGKVLGLPQLFTYFSTLVFAILNAYLITRLGIRLGANMYAAIIGGVSFLFATSALAYAFSFTQHHISTALILLALLNSLSQRTFLNNLLFGLYFGAGVLMDIPNGLIMLPLVAYVLYKHFSFGEIGNNIKLSVKLNFIALLIGLIPLLLLFGLYNYQISGSYTKFPQSIGRVDYTEEGVVERRKESGQKDPFEKKSYYNTRKQLNGFYTLLISNERGWLYYSPIIVVGILGLILGLRKKENKTLIFLGVSIALFCIVSYASFGDPWGGWSFGPRYLIPASAIVCMGIGVAIKNYKKNFLFIIIFSVLLIYSVAVNSLGAATTSAIPPKVEAVALSEPIPYTYKYNLRFVEQNKSSSLLYNIFFNNYFYFRTYLIGYIAAVLFMVLTLYVLAIREGEK